MKYRDLIQFEAVTEVIQLVTANNKETASQLVGTYVISDRMADTILHRILPAIEIGENNKGRGIFIVGNYGTGKSHLMSMLTSVAEHADLLDQLKHPGVREGLRKIAGEFLVSRQETTARKISLRDLVFSQLEGDLKKIGVDYIFPGDKDAATNKKALKDMMAKFKQVHPDKGLLIALDELLDFLRMKNEQEMIMDLNFLREVGEVCETLPLRFMAGIQEALFDNPRFQFVADSIGRVKARFDQASIVREDIAYVVSHRLLVKTEQQKKIVKKHLENFTPLYSEMAERLDTYVDLFPVHPAYLDAFEKVTIGERRELLKAISQEMERLLQKDLPADQPGLITFDSYWCMISEDNAYRAIPDVRNVLDKTQVISEKVKHAKETKDFRDEALRIIDGLALNRLTVSDIYAPIGITPAELRDQLTIYLPLPEMDADFLLATVETVLKSISTVMNGQFISHNRENDQYYLDLKKDIDYEALIQQKAEVLDNSIIDRYYFDLLTSALEIKEGSYVPGFKIWETELAWPDHGITRRGYIFLGAANERSTAHPERDYYIHFHAIFGNGHQTIKHKEDEVFYLLDQGVQDFVQPLRLFAGASEMSAISSGSNKDQYEIKARQYRQQLTKWLQEQFTRSFKVQYESNEWTIPEAIAKTKATLREMTFRDQVYRLSSAILADSFSVKFPHYPSFKGIELTSQTLASSADAALKLIGANTGTRIGQLVLESLELGQQDGNRFVWTIEKSSYAMHFIQLVNKLPPGKVINHTDLLEGEPGAERDRQFQLEPELLVVVLAALVRQGILSISLQGAQIAETELNGANRIGLDQWLRFTAISRPKPMPVKVIKELFTQFGLDPQIAADPQTLAISLPQLQQVIQNELDLVVRMDASLRDGPKFWNEMVLPSVEQQKVRKQVDDFRQFLNNLQSLSTPARLANISISVEQIRRATETRGVIKQINVIFDILGELDQSWTYLLAAQPMLPTGDDWQSELKQAREFILATLAEPVKRAVPNITSQLRGRLENIQSTYAKRYFQLHQEQRLDRSQDERKQKLTSDPRWAKMRAVSRIGLLPTRQLDEIQKKLAQVDTCFVLTPAELKTHASCPHCSFNPVAVVADQAKASARLESSIAEFDALCQGWLDVLLTNLQTEDAAHNLALVEAGEREAVQAFLRVHKLPDPLTERFINGVENTLQGLEVLTLDGADYLLALTAPGMPCTPDELEKRIREFLQKQLEGKDRRKLRIQINW